MQNPHLLSAALVFSCLFSLSFGASAANTTEPGIAQNGNAAEASGKNKTEPNKTDQKSLARSDAETILELQSAIKADIKNLVRLKKFLGEQICQGKHSLAETENSA